MAGNFLAEVVSVFPGGFPAKRSGSVDKETVECAATTEAGGVVDASSRFYSFQTCAVMYGVIIT